RSHPKGCRGRRPTSARPAPPRPGTRRRAPALEPAPPPAVSAPPPGGYPGAPRAPPPPPVRHRPRPAQPPARPGSGGGARRPPAAGPGALASGSLPPTRLGPGRREAHLICDLLNVLDGGALPPGQRDASFDAEIQDHGEHACCTPGAARPG